MVQNVQNVQFADVSDPCFKLFQRVKLRCEVEDGMFEAEGVIIGLTLPDPSEFSVEGWWYHVFLTECLSRPETKTPFYDWCYESELILIQD